jgi:cob(I)alamin adenosyltransferase
MAHLEKGYVHLYTGDGKGKTTAAMGLVLRALGAGMRVYIAQFAKGSDTGELTTLQAVSKKIVFKQFGTKSFIRQGPSGIDTTLALSGFEAAEEAVMSGKYDLVVLDELCIACLFNMVPVKRVIDLVRNRPGHVELVITGRKAPPEIREAADLVTEMKMVRHYFEKGVKARKGIEY